jgi:5-methylcytosine-specific restriction enzyme A
MQAKTNKPWTDDELAAAVDAYLEMLESEHKGRPYNKAEVNRSLREKGMPLKGRTKSSVEFRMQNISAVLQAEGHSFVKGYVPAKNVGGHVHSRIAEILKSRKAIQ